MNKRFLKKTLKAQQIEYIINKRLWQALKDQQIEYIINKKTLTCVESPTRSIIWMLSHNIIWRCMVSRVWKHVFFFFVLNVHGMYWRMATHATVAKGSWPPVELQLRPVTRKKTSCSSPKVWLKRVAARWEPQLRLLPSCDWGLVHGREKPNTLGVSEIKLRSSHSRRLGYVSGQKEKNDGTQCIVGHEQRRKGSQWQRSSM